MKAMHIAIVAGFLSTASASAAELSGTYRVVAPGTAITWEIAQPGSRETRTNIMERSDGFRVAFSRRGTERRTWVPFCWGCQSNLFEEDKYAALWPLQVGKSVSFTRTSKEGGRQWLHTIKVTGAEEITVPAGRFATFTVEEEAKSANGDWWAKSRFWWAPSVGYMVRDEVTEKDKPTVVSVVSAIKAP